ncbi:hypothetical protein DPMN_138209 [Dreissena polymorpha]|uniref:Secreted protein n=1 Tax=Dreissena polymorpha TaxID=45954 RepID=A0A9D4G3D1_DREPO|nr:hypothetical protein DPMN_138209 [Dreissena polymorpha]
MKGCAFRKILFQVACFDLFASVASMSLCIDCRQAVLSSAIVAQVSALMARAFRSLFHVSLYLSAGRWTAFC